MKQTYFFGAGDAEGRGDQKELLGGKGAGLAEMTRIGIPVPPGFTITTEVCTAFGEAGGKLPESLMADIKTAMARVDTVMSEAASDGAPAPIFGDSDNPLLYSVRSGGRVSMPGMMDTVLNLGINDVTVQGLIKQSGNARFAYDSYRRFIQMYGDVVMGVDGEHFEAELDKLKTEAGVGADIDLVADDFQKLVPRYKALIQEKTGKALPEDPTDQLIGAIVAVFESWDNDRAIAYREANDIPADWGTAVNVQVMVFGNGGDNSATGVAFTRNPATGEARFYGEFLPNAQGEDVVAGTRTPQPILKEEDRPGESLEELMPPVFEQLLGIAKKVESHFGDMQDIEFTVQDGKLWMLQTRAGKRTADAAIRIAVEMVAEGFITEDQAVLAVDADQLDQLLHPRLDPDAEKEVLAVGLPASPGAAVGAVVFHPEEAEACKERGEQTILVRIETSPEDIRGMIAAEGILTARGGMTSHAAVVSRGMGKPCVAGCGAIAINYAKELFVVAGKTIRKGDMITLDGALGEVILGEVPRLEATFAGPVEELMRWADERRTLGVRTNADTPHDSGVARGYGAEGIGLCRTEHMFFEEDRIDFVRQAILAKTDEDRERPLAALLEIQRGDFDGIFRAMDGLPVTIRLLDPPLHEFLPQHEPEIRALAKRLEHDEEELLTIIAGLHEFNPMLGHRGVRLGVTFPDIYKMQIRAILEAALAVKADGIVVKPEIMVPLIATAEELEIVKVYTDDVTADVFEKAGDTVDYLYGTMIELPRACLVADKVAKTAQFFSFGTNDLTQTAFGLSRDDAGNFLPDYVRLEVVPIDPFVSVDVDGVGFLMELACTKGRETRPDIKLGICGEHGGEPASVEFCHNLGLDYVSCSPYRVPIARLAAAQAALRAKK